MLLGRQGAGKGLIGRLVAQQLRGTFLSMGDLLRAEQRRETALGVEIGRLIDAGSGVAPDISYGLMVARLDDETLDGPVVLDGVPRLADQTSRVREMLGGEPSDVVVLDVPTPIAVERLLTRTTCSECGMPHGPGWPPLDGRCRDCGETVEARRPDDENLVKIQRRLDVWGAESRAIVDYYRLLGIVHEMPSNVPVLEVLERVLGVLGLRAN